MRMSLSVKTTKSSRPLFMHISRLKFLNYEILQKRHPHTSMLLRDEKKASYTVEAAVIMPIFLYVCVVVLFFFGVMENEWKTKLAITDAAREFSVYGSTLEDVSVDFGLLTIDNKDIEINSVYPQKIPFDFFGLGSVSVSETAKAHRWVGYDPREGTGEGLENVYVTKTGKAYHKSTGCHYLDLSICAVSSTEISGKRNTAGGKYYACPLCRGKADILYITNYGDKYHTTLSCSGLKRDISSITKEEAVARGYHPCGKCFKGE